MSYWFGLYKRFRGLTILMVMVAALSASAHAQTTYGAVRGLVRDSQGAVIEKATVTLTNSGTGVQHTTTTTGDGEYFFTAVDPGHYSISVVFTGFKRTENPDVTIGTGATATVDLTMALGGASETVEVTAGEPLIDTASANGGQTFSSQQLTSLPNLGRNPFVFQKLDTATTPVGDPRYVRAEDQTGQSTISVAGAPIGANNFAVDGIPISQSNGGVTFIPSLEAVSDVKVQANTYDAEVGRAGGGLFNTTLRSGTDRYHGVLYGMTRQTNWSANSFFGNRTPLVLNGVTVSSSTPRPDVATYLYAGAFGGPVPFSNKIKYLKDTFFWLVEEGYRQAQPLVGTGAFVVPSPAELTGDFSGDTGTTLYDPTTFPRAQMMGMKNGVPTANVIPSSYINPIGNYIAGVYPKCTLCTAAYGANNYYSTDDFKTRSDMYSGKLDHVFTPWWSGAVSYVHLATQEPSGSFLHTFANADGILHRFNDATAINNVFTLNPTTVLTVGYGFNRYYSHQVPYSESSFPGGFDQSTGFGGTGFPAAYAALVQSRSFPSIYVNGVGPAGANNLGSTSTSTAGLGASDTGPTIQYSRNLVVGLSKSVGKQNLKFGYVYRSLNNYQPQRGTSGAFYFTGQGTTSNGETISNATGTGNALADMLLGVPSNGSSSAQTLTVVGPKSFDQNIRYHALYLQDDFRMSEKLTFNLGIRYEYELGQRETQNQYAVGFDQNISYTFPCNAAAAGVASCATAHGGLAFAGQNGYPSRCCNMPGKFSPRIGVAYQVRPNTAIRGGFGIFYAPVATVVNAPGYSQTTSSAPTGNFTGALTVGTNGSLSNPFGGAQNILAPSGNTLGPLTALGQTISAQDFNRKYPLVEQYSVNVERELPWRIALNVGYIGAHGKYFPQNVSINQLPDGLMAQFRTNQTTNNVSVANPYYAPKVTVGSTTLPTTGVVSKSTITQGQLLLPYPQFPGSTGLQLIESVGYSLYNALAIKVQKQMGHGLSVLASYTWSSNWDNFYGPASAFTDSLNSTSGPQDNYNLKGEYARAVNNMPNRATFGITYQLPFGRNQMLFSGAPRLVDEFINGWEINVVSIVQNGGPLSFTQSNITQNFGVAGFGGNTMRPTLIAGVNPCRSGQPEGRLTNYFNAAAFTATPALSYSSMPRTINCYGPGYSNSDISVNKTFSFGERVKFQFRAEALNATNSSEFNNPGSTLTVTQSSLAANPSVGSQSSTFNAITGTAGFARTIQLGGRISF
jgi:trimeric autotransporter adhesin